MVMDYTSAAGEDYLGSDPLSFISNLLRTKYPGMNTGSPGGYNPLAPAVVGQSNFLDQLVSLMQLGNVDIFGQGAEGARTNTDVMTDLFNRYTSGAANQSITDPSTIRYILGAAMPQLQSTAEGLGSAQGGDPAVDPFNYIFNQVASTWGRHYAPGAQNALFSTGRRDMERAAYNTALAQGTFKGTPYEWLQSRGFI